MDILIVGDWHSRVHEDPVATALRANGHNVVEFRWHEYFRRPQSGVARALRHAARKAQNKYLVGPLVAALNRDLVRVATQRRFDLVFVYRGTHIWRKTLRRIHHHQPSTIVAGYNNDDPFSRAYPRWMWRHFMRSITAYDIVFAYRHVNLDDLGRAGARRTALLRSSFVPERINPIELSAEDAALYKADVTFVGHHEYDGRTAYLEALVESGARLRLFGPGSGFGEFDWDKVVGRSPLLRHLAPVRLVWNEEYNKALCGAKIALCFLSKLNRDTYTRRCFEIPASRTMLMSEYSDDLATLFREGEEAEYFRSPEELVRKVRYYLFNEDARRRVADAGYRRVYADGHDVNSRMREMLQHIQGIR